MFYLTIGAIFKNESHILNEWIQHYLFHGIQHIYLINDNSTDDFMTILQPYIDNGNITLYNCNSDDKYVGVQDSKYNHFFQKHLCETFWFGIFDLDEFLYSPDSVDIKNILQDNENEYLLHINWVNFGSSGFIEQPNNVVSNFVFRGYYNSTKNGPNGRYNSYKSIVKTNGRIQLGIHTHTYNNKTVGKNISFDISNTPLLINHYAIQSQNFWENIKMTRGDVNHWYDKQGWERNIQLFRDIDTNDVCDERLKNQNDNIN